MNELQKLLSEQVDWQIIAVTSVVIIGVALLAGFSCLFDDDEPPEDEYDDYNDRTG
jgi:hypothetical protein